MLGFVVLTTLQYETFFTGKKVKTATPQIPISPSTGVLL